MSTAVTVSDLCCQRGSFQLGPLSLALPAGGRLAIIGPSGSGKTTLLRCLAGFERAQRGSIRIGATTVADATTHLAPDQRGLGFVFQEGALWPHLTALAHLQFAAPKATRDEARQWLERGGIGHLADRKPAAMSGGEAQRLGMLRALVGRPPLLLLDEPLRSVDVHQRDGLVLLLRALVDELGLTTILVTHDRDEALALATDLVVLHGGQCVEAGPALQLLKAPQTAFTAAFLAGAACLPTSPDPAQQNQLQTPLGPQPRPTTAPDDLRLVLLPGEASATAAPAGSQGHGHVLATVPHLDHFLLRVAIGDQIVQARATAPLPSGQRILLQLHGAPRLLPWQANTNRNSSLS